MNNKPLLPHPSLDNFRKQAKDLVQAHRLGHPDALERIRASEVGNAKLPLNQIAGLPFQLTDAQFLIAREHGFASWSKFKSHVEEVNARSRALRDSDPATAFLDVACVPLTGSHNSGTLDAANAMLRDHPELARANIYIAAALGDDAQVLSFLASAPEAATAKGGPRLWDALTYLCFSRYLRLDHDRSDGFVGAATALLDAGASANTGWYEQSNEAQPFWESVIYGAAGIAQHPALTRLLLERGADPNDEETPYHVAESYNNTVMRVLVDSARFNADSLTTLLVRKSDMHDYEGQRYLLEHGADPNRMTRWHVTPFQQALRRDNAIENIDLFLDHGADPDFAASPNGRSAAAMAARRGRRDVLETIRRRGSPANLSGADMLIAACAVDDAEAIHTIQQNQPKLLEEIISEGGTLLAEFAGNGNTEGVRWLLDIGVGVSARYRQGDGYFQIAKESTALHVAAWRGRHDTVQFLLARGAEVNARDARGRTPLSLAVKACVDSYWMDRRSPDSVRSLLAAGAVAREVKFPCGYAEVDALLRSAAGAGIASNDKDPER